MADNITSFTMPVADKLCVAVRDVVGKFGGPHEFFEKLSRRANAVADEFLKSSRSLRSVLVRCLDDIAFRARFLERVSADQERRFLAEFLSGWDVWKELEPVDNHWISLALIGAPTDALSGPIPDRTNEVYRCTSSLALDISSDDLHVKTCIQLLFPNKSLGGDGVLVLSSSVTSLLQSIRLVLRSLELTNRSPAYLSCGRILK